MPQHLNSLRPTLEPRTVLLADIENLCGGAELVGPHFRAARHALGAAVAHCGKLMTIIAHGTHVRESLPELPFEWPGRFIVRGGVDGADLALLDAIYSEPAARRSASVVIASGDAIFADAAAELVGRGVFVTVASRPSCLARRLRLAASRVVELRGLDELVRCASQPLGRGLGIAS